MVFGYGLLIFRRDEPLSETDPRRAMILRSRVPNDMYTLEDDGSSDLGLLRLRRCQCTVKCRDHTESDKKRVF